MKKLLCLVFALVLCLSMAAFAAEEVVTITDVDITQKLVLEGKATYNGEDNSILICPAEDWSNGRAKYPFEVLEDFTVTFEYKIGGGSSADGIMLAFFAEKNSVVKDGGFMNFDGCGGYGLEFDTYRNDGDSQYAHVAIVRDTVSNHLVSADEPRVDDEEWHTASLKVDGNLVTLSIDGEYVIDEYIEFDKTYRYMYFAASTGSYNDNHYIRNVRFTGRAAYANASNWAITEMDKAEEYGIIPAALKGADMTQKINRYEFCALAVSLYESFGNPAQAVEMPFTDTDKEEIAKAYGLGITKGVSDTLFDMYSYIPREQVATMLTRTMTAINPKLDTSYGDVEKFADDASISSWAKDSVYFMASRGIVNGVGDNKFAPKNTTTAEEATLYANSTREQAIIIAVRAYESLLADRNA